MASGGNTDPGNGATESAPTTPSDGIGPEPTNVRTAQFTGDGFAFAMLLAGIGFLFVNIGFAVGFFAGALLLALASHHLCRLQSLQLSTKPLTLQYGDGPPREVRTTLIIATGICIALSVILSLIVWGTASLLLPRAAPAESNLVKEMQLRTLGEIDAFIGSAENLELASAFDLPNIFFHNAEMARNGLLHRVERSENAAYFDGGQAFLDRRFLENGRGGSATCRAPVTCSFNLSKKFVDKYRSLKEYENYVSVPDSIKKTLRELDGMIQDDETAMSDLINGNKTSILELTNPAYIAEHGSILSTYNYHVQNLNVVAEKVRQSIKAFIDRQN